MGFSFHCVFAKLVELEYLSCVVNDDVQASEVLNLTLEVGLAFFADIIARVSVLGMDVVARSKNNINILLSVGPR